VVSTHKKKGEEEGPPHNVGKLEAGKLGLELCRSPQGRRPNRGVCGERRQSLASMLWVEDHGIPGVLPLQDRRQGHPLWEERGEILQRVNDKVHLVVREGDLKLPGEQALLPNFRQRHIQDLSPPKDQDT